MTMTLSCVHSMPAEVDGLAVRDPRDAAAKAGLGEEGDRRGCQRYKDKIWQDGAGLDVAEVDGLAEGSERVAGGDEFMGDVAAEVRSGDAAHNAVPLDFLGAVEFVAAGHAAGVKVSDPIDIFLDSADQVTFHDLHVIDVVEQLDAGRINGLDDLHSQAEWSHM